MQNGLLVGVEIENTFGNIECELLPVFPAHLDVSIMQKRPQRASRAVLKNNAKVGSLCASSKEQNDVGMSDNLHDSALILELL